MVVWCRCHARRCAIFLPLSMQTRKQLFVLHPISVCLWDVWLYEELDANLHQKQEKCKSRGYAKLRKMVLEVKKVTQNCAKPVRQGSREIKTNDITACFSIKNTYRGTAVAKWMEKSHIVTLRNDMAFYDGRWSDRLPATSFCSFSDLSNPSRHSPSTHDTCHLHAWWLLLSDSPHTKGKAIEWRRWWRSA